MIREALMVPKDLAASQAPTVAPEVLVFRRIAAAGSLSTIRALAAVAMAAMADREVKVAMALMVALGVWLSSTSMC